MDIRFPNALQQFDEYQALVVQQRAPGDPRPLFQLSQGPSPVQYNVAAEQHGFLCGHELRLAKRSWMDPNLHPGYVMNWNATVEYQISANNMLKLIYQGSAGVDLVESWNINAFPHISAPTIRRCSGGVRGDAELSALSAVRQHQPDVQYGSLHLPRRARCSSRSATRRVWC